MRADLAAFASHFQRGNFVVKAMNKLTRAYLQRIKGFFPQGIEVLTVHDNGDDFVVLEVNQDWMFRFPRQEFSKKAFAVEKSFLSKFNHISPFPVPNYQYSEDDFGGYVFVVTNSGG